MARGDPPDWLLSEAVEMLVRAERLQRQFFRLQDANARSPAWEPPIDVLETEDELLVVVALPGVDPEQVEAVIEDGALVVAGRRVLPGELSTAVIHRMELPQGRFERRIALPGGRYDSVLRFALHGCLLISLHEAG